MEIYGDAKRKTIDDLIREDYLESGKAIKFINDRFILGWQIDEDGEWPMLKLQWANQGQSDWQFPFERRRWSNLQIAYQTTYASKGQRSKLTKKLIKHLCYLYGHRI